MNVREIAFCGDGESFERFLPILKQCHTALKYLRIATLNDGNASEYLGLVGVQLYGLKTLDVSGLIISEDEWDTVFMNCSNVEHLYLGIITDDVAVERIIKAITSFMKQLRTLQLKDYGFITYLGHPGVCNNLHLLSQLSQLESLYLSYICCASHALLDLCEIKSLRYLSLNMGSHRRCVNVKEFEAFVNKLKMMESNIHTLSIVSSYTLNDSILKQLGQVKSISSLVLQRVPTITDDGINAFISNDERTKKTATVYNCRNVSRSGVWEQI
ncbi:hypothetical protein BDA99DRAFT_530113 [Phascolomyces articulosus]|uniref:Uncharacterized protein n=1 Tax=Phascolomyces articulosus TaxID=60185 RepID=A0AAD5JYZ6_9FUNG|nr:hypothetical protein BDA99DRAFT_530113 [Phascolomyces articulosus]